MGDYIGFRVWGSGFRGIIPIMENQMEKKMEKGSGNWVWWLIG